MSIKKALEWKRSLYWNRVLDNNQTPFDALMTELQKEKPMIHLLYSSREKHLKKTMGRLLKSRAYTKKKGNTWIKEVDVYSVDFLLTNYRQYKVWQALLSVAA